MKAKTLTAKRLLKRIIVAAPKMDRPRLAYSVLGVGDGHDVWICPRSAGDQERIRFLLASNSIQYEINGEPGTSGEYIIEIKI